MFRYCITLCREMYLILIANLLPVVFFFQSLLNFRSLVKLCNTCFCEIIRVSCSTGSEYRRVRVNQLASSTKPNSSILVMIHDAFCGVIYFFIVKELPVWRILCQICEAALLCMLLVLLRVVSSVKMKWSSLFIQTGLY